VKRVKFSAEVGFEGEDGFWMKWEEEDGRFPNSILAT
jgi:hypothetical protein